MQTPRGHRHLFFSYFLIPWLLYTFLLSFLTDTCQRRSPQTSLPHGELSAFLLASANGLDPFLLCLSCLRMTEILSFFPSPPLIRCGPPASTSIPRWGL